MTAISPWWLVVAFVLGGVAWHITACLWRVYEQRRYEAEITRIGRPSGDV